MSPGSARRLAAFATENNEYAPGRIGSHRPCYCSLLVSCNVLLRGSH